MLFICFSCIEAWLIHNLVKTGWIQSLGPSTNAHGLKLSRRVIEDLFNNLIQLQWVVLRCLLLHLLNLIILLLLLWWIYLLYYNSLITSLPAIVRAVLTRRRIKRVEVVHCILRFIRLLLGATLASFHHWYRHCFHCSIIEGLLDEVLK